MYEFYVHERVLPVVLSNHHYLHYEYAVITLVKSLHFVFLISMDRTYECTYVSLYIFHGLRLYACRRVLEVQTRCTIHKCNICHRKHTFHSSHPIIQRILKSRHHCCPVSFQYHHHLSTLRTTLSNILTIRKADRN